MTYRTLTEEQVNFYKKNGYLRIPDFLTETEVKKFKEGCKKRLVGDTANHPEFDHITISARMVNILKDLLGEDVIYPGLSFTRTEDFPKKFGSRHLHSDAAYENNDFSQDAPIINTGFYLQDQTRYSGTLKLIPGSQHRERILIKTVSEGVKKFIRLVAKGEFTRAFHLFDAVGIVSVDSGPRDLILWSVRIHHSGYGLRFKWFPKLSLLPVLENWIPRWMHVPLNPERDVILSIYASPGEYFERYMDIQKRKAHRREHFLASKLETIEIQRLAKESGVTIRNDGYHYAIDPQSEFVTRTDKGLVSGGQ